MSATLRIAQDSLRRPQNSVCSLLRPTGHSSHTNKADHTVLKTTASGWQVGQTPQYAVPSASPPRPRSAAEQYWAARALTAETLLTARKEHERELRNIASAGDAKRSKEVSAVQAAYDIRLKKMEHMLTFCVFCITSLMGVVVYLLAIHPRPKQTRSSWGLASHFTIPILSPFTSVVEHEASLLGARIIVPSVLILSGLCYALFRYWWRHMHVS
ncbi:hypothetical protein BV25DRAFT_1993216 [Artomyces pyxidatus]|uniref:Uncharacterized protein n=1 Tax=Artomyces pyxidatus TaxID=48021 RepID=A0ACB8STK3_9AGAM|nr:hypothetical protein BV25DRAFT_1993216 [Artomyces pyxidatus]